LHEEYWCWHGAPVFILIRTVQASQREACEGCGRTKLPSLKQHYDSQHNIRPSMLTSVPHMVVNALKVLQIRKPSIPGSIWKSDLSVIKGLERQIGVWSCGGLDT
jgi:hypothetical protein